MKNILRGEHFPARAVHQEGVRSARGVREPDIPIRLFAAHGHLHGDLPAENAVLHKRFHERALLREFVLQRKSVLNLPEAEPSVRSLLDSNVLQIVGEHEEDTTRAPMIITKQARPFITYRAIGLTRSKMNDQMLEQIMNARPDFAREKKTQPRAYRGIKAA